MPFFDKNLGYLANYLTFLKIEPNTSIQRLQIKNITNYIKEDHFMALASCSAF